MKKVYTEPSVTKHASIESAAGVYYYYYYV